MGAVIIGDAVRDEVAVRIVGAYFVYEVGNVVFRTIRPILLNPLRQHAIGVCVLKTRLACVAITPGGQIAICVEVFGIGRDGFTIRVNEDRKHP